MKQFLLIGAGLIALCNTAAAQPANPIEHCRETSDGKSERIACLEAAITALMGQQTAATSVDDTADAPAAESVFATSDQTPTAAADTATAEAESTETAAPTGLGAEQVVARQRIPKGDQQTTEDRSETSLIVDVAVNRSGKYVFFLENGQVWRQKSSDSNNSRLSKKLEYTATVFEGALSGYRMRVTRVPRPFLVERIK